MQKIDSDLENNDKGCFNAGWAMGDITPERTVAIVGQFNDRFSERVLDPITVTALAMETVDEKDKSVSQSVMVSCDICFLPEHIQKSVKQRIGERLKDFNSDNIFMAATHIHTGPYLERYYFKNIQERVFVWPTYNKEVMTPEEYSEFMVNKVCDAIAMAWNNRKKASVGWQLGHAAVGHNRRLTYDDGTSMMYGNSNTINYRGPEGPEDSGVELLYLWNEKNELTGIVVNVACPAQVIEHKTYISADYWGEVRKKVWATYGKEVCVFAMCGAAGDQSPRDLVRRGRGEKNMWEVEGMSELAGNLLNTIKYKYEAAKKSKVSNPVLKHVVKTLPIPYRGISKEQYEEGKAKFDFFIQKYNLDKKPIDKKTMSFEDQVALHEAEGVLSRHKEKENNPVYNAEAHFVRVGDIAIVTNPFELFTTYGLIIKARSRAVQTFISQLTCDSSGYLATKEAIYGGHYSTTISSGKVGPEGGELLVEYSVKYINELWD